MNGTIVAQLIGSDMDTDHDNSERYHSGPADRVRPVQTMTIVNSTIVAQLIGSDLDTDHDNSE